MDKQNGKITTCKHWKCKTKAKIIKHSFETERTKQNGQSGQPKWENKDIQTLEIYNNNNKLNL